MESELLVGRKKEIKQLKQLFDSREAELVAVYGRRRIGKTFLIREVMREHICFELVGENKGSLKVQLSNFCTELLRLRSPLGVVPPRNWTEAFFILSTYLEEKLATGKKVVFFDEFPWLDSPKSGFLSAFDHWWNSWANKQKGLIVIICGSAAAWMIQNVIKNNGGLYNRVTQNIQLAPFTLFETASYLASRNIHWNHRQIVEMYMALGGVPAYLKLINKGESVAQAIDRLCFDPSGHLANEFDLLYASLFNNATLYIDVIKLLSKKNKGFTRKQIIDRLKLNSGGGLTTVLRDLEASSFIGITQQYGGHGQNKYYKLVDEFSLFYLKFMATSQHKTKDSWLMLSGKPAWMSWSGQAFERICRKHISKINEALGLKVIHTHCNSWSSAAADTDGAQIDLLIDRADGIINLCELKFSNSKFTIDKKYAEELRYKREVFKQVSKAKKQVSIVMLTTYGVTHNDYYLELVENELTVDDLF